MSGETQRPLLDRKDNMLINAQVPDDMADYLNEQSVLMSSGELTTKDIMKHFSDRNANGHSPRHFTKVTDPAARLPPRRTDTDSTLWQQEASVRTVHDPSIPYVGGSQGTPPHPRHGAFNGPGQNSPYGHFDRAGTDTPDSGERNQTRASWARQNSGLTTGTV